ncbi:hypothetical protein [Croceicoccus naphthovorans]|uniref:Uncharacterized protein n=1 Tax=Croceicoccus naphthovorans TaxID=1348774 RepID=A0A0G3XJD3_9SPHN|nr:hypothetical protein [Croceicoccus naphthovorans]AKM11665.1 hypothetical protein AB433_08315 [Croceicoccus naphthovorans]MBB3991153.1 hypothetical protein [Croceicoccus naphthovorans]
MTALLTQSAPRPAIRRFDAILFAVLATVMLATRPHSLSEYIHLPETSLASFLVAGFYIRSHLAFPALFALGFAIDVVTINLMGGSDFCFTAAYWMLLPAYGVMWMAGRFGAARIGITPARLPALIAILCGAALISNAFSSGGFYALSGHFPDATIAGWLPRLERYFPGTLIATLSWAGIAAVAHIMAERLAGWTVPDSSR